MAEQERLGALRSKIELTLHTHHAERLWNGRRPESGRPQIIGMRNFLLLAGKVKNAAAKDDPYADYWLLQVDERLAAGRKDMDDKANQVQQILDQLPEELHVEANVNQRPATIQVFTGGQHGWLAVRLLIDFDRLVRNVLLAHHIALIGRKQHDDLIRVGGHAVRSLCASLERWPGYTGACRDDFAANNAKARAAIEKHGELPKDILDGSTRSDFAPPITRTRTQANSSPSIESETRGDEN